MGETMASAVGYAGPVRREMAVSGPAQVKDMRPLEVVQNRVVDLAARARGIGYDLAVTADRVLGQTGGTDAIGGPGKPPGPEPEPGSLPAIHGQLSELETALDKAVQQFERIRHL